MESGEIKRDPRLEEKIHKLHRVFNLKSVRQIIEECKQNWKGEQTPPNKALSELKETNDPAADLVSKAFQAGLQEGSFSATTAYKKILEENGENMNQKDKKNLRKKLKRKQKKIKKLNPDFAHDQPDPSDAEDQEEPETAPSRKPLSKQHPNPPSSSQQPEPLEVIADPFE